MATRVRVSSSGGNRVAINTQNRTRVRTIGTSGSGVNELTELNDVDTTSLDDGEVLVYDSSLNKFIIKTLPNLDGGEF